MAFDWGNLAAGGLAGAGAGATLGSAFPGVGTGLGALLGGGAGALASYFGGGQQPGGPQRTAAPNQQEQNILQYLLSQGMSGLQNPGQGFQPIADQARTQFNQQTVPSLAERFTSLGSNRLSSPSFVNQLGQAGSGLEQALAAMQAQYSQKGQQNALQQLTLGLSPAFQTYYQPKEHGFGRELMGSAIQAAPALYQSYQLQKAIAALANKG